MHLTPSALTAHDETRSDNKFILPMGDSMVGADALTSNEGILDTGLFPIIWMDVATNLEVTLLHAIPEY